MTDTISKDQAVSGWINGFIGVLLFSGSMPATKLAVMEMNPYLLRLPGPSLQGYWRFRSYYYIKKGGRPKIRYFHWYWSL